MNSQIQNIHKRNWLSLVVKNFSVGNRKTLAACKCKISKLAPFFDIRRTVGIQRSTDLVTIHTHQFWSMY